MSQDNSSPESGKPVEKPRAGKRSITELMRELTPPEVTLTKDVWIPGLGVMGVARVFSTEDELQFLGKLGEPYRDTDDEKYGLKTLSSQKARVNRWKVIWGLVYGAEEPTYDFGEAIKAVSAKNSSLVVDPLFNVIQELNPIAILDAPEDESKDPIFTAIRAQTRAGRALQAAAREGKLGEVLKKIENSDDPLQPYLEHVDLITRIQLANETGFAKMIAESLAPLLAPMLGLTLPSPEN